MSFTSEPEGATVVMDNRILGKTPFSILIKKHLNGSVIVQKEGYTPQTINFNTTIEGWFFGNIL
jgi:hypothetical protein